jgi:hypothetical protein
LARQSAALAEQSRAALGRATSLLLEHAFAGREQIAWNCAPPGDLASRMDAGWKWNSIGSFHGQHTFLFIFISFHMFALAELRAGQKGHDPSSLIENFIKAPFRCQKFYQNF